jgi:esterase/lipase superfamily enzyme
MLAGCSDKNTASTQPTSTANPLIGKWQLIRDTNREMRFLANGQLLYQDNANSVTVASYTLASSSNVTVVGDNETNAAEFFFPSPDELLMTFRGEGGSKSELLKRVR